MEGGSQAQDHGQAIYAKIRYSVSGTFATGCSSFNLPHCSDCSSHREHIQGFFYTKESQSFVKPSSFKSQPLKFSTKSIINAVLSTNLFFFLTLCHVRGLEYRCLYTPICKNILESLDSIKRRACAQNVCFSILLRFSN